MGQGNPKDKHRLRDEWLESSPEVKDSGVLLDEKLNRIQECALAKPQPKVGYRNTNRELGMQLHSTVKSESSETFFTLPSLHAEFMRSIDKLKLRTELTFTDIKSPLSSVLNVIVI